VTELVNKELERMWNEVVMDKFKIISQNFSQGTEENHEKSQPE
jgi:hypothetical protein